MDIVYMFVRDHMTNYFSKG